MSDFTERQHKWERRIEDVLIEISRETDAQGFGIPIDIRPVVEEFNIILGHIRLCKAKSKESKHE